MPRKKITNTNSSSFYHEPAVWMVGLSYVAGMLIMLLIGVMVNPIGSFNRPPVEGLSASAGSENGAGVANRSFGNSFGATALSDEDNLIRNGSFELPITRTLSSVVVASNPQFGWDVEWTTRGNRTTASDRQPGVEVLSGYKDWKAGSGAQFVRLDIADIKARSERTRSLVTLSQGVKTQARDYALSFLYAPQPGTGASDNKITVRWNGAVLDEYSVSGESDLEPVWQEYTFTVTGSGGTDKLEFISEGDENGQGNLLDSVNLSEVEA